MDWGMFWKKNLQSYIEIVDKEEKFNDDKKNRERLLYAVLFAEVAKVFITY